MSTEWCALCGAEYLAGTRECTDCIVPLVDQRPLTVEDLGALDEEQVSYDFADLDNEERLQVGLLLADQGIPHAWDETALVVRAADEAAMDELIAGFEGTEVVDEDEYEEDEEYEEEDEGEYVDEEEGEEGDDSYDETDAGAEDGEYEEYEDEEYEEEEELVDGEYDEEEEEEEEEYDEDEEYDEGEEGEVVYDLEDWTEEQRAELIDALSAAGIPFEWDEKGELVVSAADEERVEAVIDAIDFPDQLPIEEHPGDEGLAATEALSELFLSADRLMHDPDDHEAVLSLHDVARLAETLEVPYGFNPAIWRDLVTQASSMRKLLEGETDDDEVREAARSLRNLLRPWV